MLRRFYLLIERIHEPSLCYENCFYGLICGFLNKHFAQNNFSVLLLCVDNISSKHDPETTASKLNLMLLILIHASLLGMSANFIGFFLLGLVFGHFFDTQLMNFI